MAHLGTVGTATSGAATSTLAITLTDGVPVGATILIGCAWESSAGSVPTVSSVVDSSGNTYSTTPDVSSNAGTTVAVAVLRGRITTALDAGDTITVTVSGGTRSRWTLQAVVFDDVDVSPLDEVASNAPGSSASLSTGTTAATEQDYELLYAVFGFGSGRTTTIPESWSGGAKVETAAGSSDRALQVTHMYTSAAGAQQGSLTISSASTYAAGIATYRATSLAPAVADVTRLALTVPAAPEVDPAVADVTGLLLTVPSAGASGEVQVSKLRLTVPTVAGQAPYSGVRVSDGGALRNVALWAGP